MQRIATIGMFDGVHRGHRYLLGRLKDAAREMEMQPAVVTFSSHPLAIVRPEAAPRLLTSVDEKTALLANEQVGVIVINFDAALRALPAAAFLKRLRDEYGVGALMLGFDNRFGSDRLGYDGCREVARELGMQVLTAPELPADSRVSSSAVRRAVAEGDMARAAELLGRPYALTGIVEDGNRIGRTIGFPTANVRVDDPDKLLPRVGVYGCEAVLPDGARHRAVVNIGSRPTVDSDCRVHIEAFLLGFEGNLYNRPLTLEFLTRLRDERKFPSLDALRSQIEADIDGWLHKR